MIIVSIINKGVNKFSSLFFSVDKIVKIILERSTDESNFFATLTAICPVRESATNIVSENFVNSLINDLNLNELKELDYLVSLDDENLINIKNNILNEKVALTNIIKRFQEF